jgi:hypothetical protein
VRAAAVPRDGLQRVGGDALLHAAGFSPLYGHEPLDSHRLHSALATL